MTTLAAIELSHTECNVSVQALSPNQAAFAYSHDYPDLEKIKHTHMDCFPPFLEYRISQRQAWLIMSFCSTLPSTN